MGAYLTFPDGVLSFTTLSFDGVIDEAWDAANEITTHPVETGANITDNIRVGLAKVQLQIFCTNEPHQANSFTTPTLTLTNIQIPGTQDQDSEGIFNDLPDRTTPPGTVTAKEWNNALNFSAALKGVGSIVGSKVGGSLGSVVGTAVGGIAAALIDQPGEKDVTFAPIGGLGVDAKQADQVTVSLYTQSSTDDFVERMYSALETLRTSGTLITVHGSKNHKENMAIASVNMHRSADTGTGAEFTISLEEIRFVTTQTVTAPAATVPRAKAPAHKGPQNPTPAKPQLTRSVMRDLALQAVKTGGGMLSPDQSAAAGLTPGDIAAISGG